MNARNLVSTLFLGVGLLGFLSGCSAVSEADRALAHEIMAQSGSNCIHIEGGMVMGTIPGLGATTGGGWRGSLTAAHSEADAPLTCGPTGAAVTPTHAPTVSPK